MRKEEDDLTYAQKKRDEEREMKNFEEANMTEQELTDDEFFEKFGLCREDAKQIIWENSEELYTHR